MKCSKENLPVSKNTYEMKANRNLLQFTLGEQLAHGMDVSNLVYTLAREVGFDEDICYHMAVAGMIHDIGKVGLKGMVDDKNALVVEEMKVVRLHPNKGCEIAKRLGYSDMIAESILEHHENFDGSGYPENKRGRDIHFGGRLLRICDVYAALTTDRPYRPAFTEDAAFSMMIEQAKYFDLEYFLAFQRMIHKYKRKQIKALEVQIDWRGEIQ